MNETVKWILINIIAWFALIFFIFITRVFEDIRKQRWAREDAEMKAKIISVFINKK